MKDSKKLFKNTLKYCRDNEQKIRKENLLEKFNHGSRALFWRELSKLKGSNTGNVSYIDGISDPAGIAEIFDRKYRTIFDDKHCQSEGRINGLEDVSHHHNFPLVSLNDICD